MFTRKNLDEIRSEDILNYKHHLETRANKRKGGSLSESYVHHQLYALQTYFKWQQELGHIIENPISGLSFKTPKSQIRSILSREEIEELYSCCQTLREEAILSLFYGCGLRRSEAESLNLNDIKFSSGLLYVREGKNKQRRAIPLSHRVKRHLLHYCQKERYSRDHETAVICNRRGRRTRGESYNLTLKHLLSRTEITKNISLHNLRHSIATHLLQAGLSVDYVREFLGHKHLESTQIYTRISQTQLDEL